MKQVQADKTESILQTLLPRLPLLLIVAGFAGPWLYGPLGKTQDHGWQPIWGLLLNFIALNVFIVASTANCLSYLEMYMRLGKPVLEGALRWIGAFLGLVVLVPLVVWLIFDQTQRSPTALVTDGTFGWGMWLALAGLILQIIALRWRIQIIKKEQTL